MHDNGCNFNVEGAGTMRKLHLVYSPLTRARVPFGIALLKGFIQANSDVEVKCIDLNLAMYDDLAIGK